MQITLNADALKHPETGSPIDLYLPGYLNNLRMKVYSEPVKHLREKFPHITEEEAKGLIDGTIPFTQDGNNISFERTEEKAEIEGVKAESAEGDSVEVTESETAFFTPAPVSESTPAQTESAQIEAAVTESAPVETVTESAPMSESAPAAGESQAVAVS